MKIFLFFLTFLVGFAVAASASSQKICSFLPEGTLCASTDSVTSLPIDYNAKEMEQFYAGISTFCNSFKKQSNVLDDKELDQYYLQYKDVLNPNGIYHGNPLTPVAIPLFSEGGYITNKFNLNLQREIAYDPQDSVGVELKNVQYLNGTGGELRSSSDIVRQFNDPNNFEVQPLTSDFDVIIKHRVLNYNYRVALTFKVKILRFGSSSTPETYFITRTYFPMTERWYETNVVLNIWVNRDAVISGIHALCDDSTTYEEKRLIKENNKIELSSEVPRRDLETGLSNPVGIHFFGALELALENAIKNKKQKFATKSGNALDVYDVNPFSKDLEIDGPWYNRLYRTYKFANEYLSSSIASPYGQDFGFRRKLTFGFDVALVMNATPGDPLLPRLPTSVLTFGANFESDAFDFSQTSTDIGNAASAFSMSSTRLVFNAGYHWNKLDVIGGLYLERPFVETSLAFPVSTTTSNPSPFFKVPDNVLAMQSRRVLTFRFVTSLGGVGFLKGTKLSAQFGTLTNDYSRLVSVPVEFTAALSYPLKSLFDSPFIRDLTISMKYTKQGLSNVDPSISPGSSGGRAGASSSSIGTELSYAHFFIGGPTGLIGFTSIGVMNKNSQPWQGLPASSMARTGAVFTVGLIQNLGTDSQLGLSASYNTGTEATGIRVVAPMSEKAMAKIGSAIWSGLCTVGEGAYTAACSAGSAVKDAFVSLFTGSGDVPAITLSEKPLLVPRDLPIPKIEIAVIPPSEFLKSKSPMTSVVASGIMDPVTDFQVFGVVTSYAGNRIIKVIELVNSNPRVLKEFTDSQTILRVNSLIKTFNSILGVHGNNQAEALSSPVIDPVTNLYVMLIVKEKTSGKVIQIIESKRDGSAISLVDPDTISRISSLVNPVASGN